MSLERSEKAKMSAQLKHIPKDAQVVMSILKELNIKEYEPRVINQLLDFTYRYVTCVLDDAKVFANHARKKAIDIDDVRLATDSVLDKAFTTPPPREALCQLTRAHNVVPLPALKPVVGLRLPPERCCITAYNYKLRASEKPQKMLKSAIDGRTLPKTLTNAAAVTLKRGTPLLAKTQTISIPRPVLQFTTTIKTEAAEECSNKISTLTNSSELATSDLCNITKMEVDIKLEPASTSSLIDDACAGGSVGSAGGLKRKCDPDDYDML